METCSLGSRPSPYVRVLIARGWANRGQIEARGRPGMIRHALSARNSESKKPDIKKITCEAAPRGAHEVLSYGVPFVSKSIL